jgi:aspartokinase-like uncharacterized kinase
MIVVKVGGSLFDLPDLGRRLRSLLTAGINPAARHEVVLVPGGGPAADVVRRLDRCHGLGDAVAHELALRAMTLSAHFLAALLEAAGAGPVPVASRPAGPLTILDAFGFALGDPVLPASWDATSDSVAARVAVVLGADELVLLKSVTLPEPVDWEETARAGHVDPLFAQMTRTIPRVRVVNLRTCPGE